MPSLVGLGFHPGPQWPKTLSFLQSPAIAGDCYILVVLFFIYFIFSVHQIFDLPGPIFAKICDITRYVLK